MFILCTHLHLDTNCGYIGEVVEFVVEFVLRWGDSNKRDKSNVLESNHTCDNSYRRLEPELDDNQR